MQREPELGMIGSRSLVFAAAVSGFICVAIGAMGAHSLPKNLQKAGFSETVIAKKIEQCEIAVRYQMYHTLAILGLALSPAIRQRRAWRVSCVLFFLGILLFSGGLYSMVFFDRMGHWSIVPIGGTVLIIAWIAIAFSTLFPDKSDLGTGVSPA